MILAEVREYNGSPTLYIDGVPSSGAMHWNRYPTAEDAQRFKRAGVNLFSFMGRLPLRKIGEEAIYRDGLADFPEMNSGYIDRTMSMLVAANPEIKVLPRLRITVPEWWQKEHPESLIRSYSLRKKEFEAGPHVSLNHAEFNALLAESLTNTVLEFEQRWGNYIFGYHTGVHDCAEHAYRWGHYVSDFGQTQLPYFRAWLKGKYTTPEQLRNAWGSQDADFDSLSFPPIEQFFSADRLDARMLFSTPLEMPVVDFLEFSSQMMADSVIFQAKCVKDALHKIGRQKVFGAFYGYLNLPANLLDHYALGHYALDKIYACKEIDFLCAPISYDARNNGGVAAPQAVPGSIAVNGKLYYAEDDTRCHLALNHGDCVTASSEQTRHILLRNFLDARRMGGAMWWMDLWGEGWFRDDACEKIFADLNKLAEDTTGNLGSQAAIAVFVSDTSRIYERCAPASISGNLVGQTLNEIAAIGASYELYRIEDLPRLAEQGLLPQYRFCIVLDAISISDALCACIKENLQCDGRTILWFYLPGYIRDGRADVSAVCSLTGIGLKEIKYQRASMITETWMDGVRLSYGHPRNITPRLTGCDPDADNLGFYVEGVGADHPEIGNGASLISKQFSNWRSVWSSSPNMPSCLLTRFAREAGVHIYSAQGDQVFALSNMLGVYAKFDGEHSIELPESMSVVDYFTAEGVIANESKFTLPMMRGDCRLFILNKS